MNRQFIGGPRDGDDASQMTPERHQVSEPYVGIMHARGIPLGAEEVAGSRRIAGTFAYERTATGDYAFVGQVA